MTQGRRKNRLWARFLDGIDRVTPVRVVLLIASGALIVVHGLFPKAFIVDEMTLGLLGIAVVIALVPLIKTANLPGGASFQFREQLDKLEDASKKAVEDQGKSESVPQKEPLAGQRGEDESKVTKTEHREADGRETGETVIEILREASRSPRVGLIMLSGELESAIRQLLAATGWATPTSARSISAGVARLVEVGVMTESASSALSLFTAVRNNIVHGRATASDDEELRALDAGITLLRAVAAIPRERNLVEDGNVALFSDEAGTIPVGFGHGVLLRSQTPGGTVTTFRIFPTTKTDYVVGKEITWEWGLETVWGETWYRDGTTGEIHYAWTSSVEFRGRHLEDV